MRYIALLLMCSAVHAGPWNPSSFIPMTHADGSQTWTIKILLSDLPKEQRSAPTRDEQVASAMLAHHKFCPAGWEITDSTVDNKWLHLSGKCITH